MYNPTTLYFQNLMSFKEAKLDFTLETFIIYGENQFDRGQRANGVGKSALIEALTLIFTGKPLRKGVVINDLISDEEDELYLYFKMQNSLYRAEIEIERKFFRKTSKSQEIIIKENGEQIAITDPNHGNQIILDYLGIQRDDLLNYYLISKDRYNSFFGFSDNSKKEIISRFSNIELIDPSIINIDNQILKVKNDLQKARDDRNIKLGSLQTYQLELQKEEERDLDKETKQKIEEYNSRINTYKSNIQQYSSNKLAIEKTINDLNAQIEQIDSTIEISNTQLLEINNKIGEINNSFQSLYQEEREIDNKKSEADLLLNNEVECPKCTHKFSAYNSTKDLQKVKAAIPILEKLKLEIGQKIQDAKDQSTKLTSNRDTISNSITNIKNDLPNLKSTLKSKTDLFNSIDSNIQNFKNSIEAEKKLIETLEKIGIQSNKESLIKSIQEVDNSIQQIDQQITKIEEEIDHKTDLKNLLLKFKTSLVNKTVKVIEFYCNRILLKMGSSLSINIEGYKYKNNGKDLVEKITTTVYREGLPSGNFWRFSSGERARIEIANILSLQSLINSTSPSGGLNLLFLDEIIGSVDSEGISGIVSELNNNFSKSIFIVTFATYNGVFDNKIRVIKQTDGNSIIDLQNAG